MRRLLENAYAQLLAGRASAALISLTQAIALGPARAEDYTEQPGCGSTSPSMSRLAIRTLGGFELFVDGEPLAVGKKPARRTLGLLKAMVAFGGRDVCRWSIADALWPDIDGDRAQNALEVALHRLRLRLGVPEAVVSQQGCLSLNPHLVWVDAFAFCSAAEAMDPAAGSEPIERAFAVYRGPFLPQDSDCVWAMRLRSRLRAHFTSIVAGAAAVLESRNRLEEAIRLYERGIAADEAVTAFHDGLARCLTRLGRTAELRASRQPSALAHNWQDAS
jgi:DNA-binding SARP family transcriptional activator